MSLNKRALAFCAAAFAYAAPALAQQDEGDRLGGFFEEVYQRDIDRSPIRQSRQGVRTDQDKWDDISEARRSENHALDLADLNRLHEFDFDALSAQDKLSYRFFEWASARNLEAFEWRRNAYLVSQMGGMHTRIATTLMNDHPIKTRDDAQDYISRLRGVKTLMEQLVVELKRQEAAGVRPPRFVYPLVVGPAENVIEGAPFDESGEDSPLWADFKKKIETAKLGGDEALLEEARAALLGDFASGYRALIAHLQADEENADDRDGAWKLPSGDAYYRYLLRSYTTLDLDPGEVHALGVREVARLHDEMRAVMRATGFKGDLKEFFDFMRADPQFYYENSETGRETYIADARRLLSEIESRSAEILGVTPEAAVIVQPVEAWREKSAAKAFYSSPPQDGSRPGIFYINLYDMKAAPKYQLPVILYHEAVPGHHVETVVAYELQGLPKFRKFAGIAAFSEGWGLYSELLPKEMGLYQDQYDDFGRLSLSLMRAIRLVVDTGIHAKRWTREEAVAYMDENMPSSHYDNQREVDRYIVIPGQATSYYIGMMKIMGLREHARESLGEKFDIRGFHDVVLGDGPLPLPLLEENIDAYIAAVKSGGGR